MKNLTFHIPVLFILFSCGTGKTVTTTSENEPEKFPFGNYLISYGGCGGRDSLEFIRAGDNLYRDYKGEWNLFLCALNFCKTDTPDHPENEFIKVRGL